MKKKRDGFPVTVDNRRVWVVLRRREGGEVLHATFWWHGKMFWRSTDCTNHETAKAVAKNKVVEVVGTSADTLTLRSAIDSCVAARWPEPETYDQHRKVTLLNLNSFAEFTGEDTNLKTVSFEFVV